MKYCPICQREYADDSLVCPSDGAVLGLPGAKPDPFAGQEIKGRYRILSKLGQGGTGAVYLAEHKWMRRKVTLKVLRQDLAQDDAHVARFRLEARLTGNLDHRNIPRVYDFDQTEDGSLFIVMEFVEGHTLTALIGERGLLGLGPGRALRIALQVAEGLQAAHRKDVIHRDIKPDNIMVETGDVVKVMDFGVARLRELESSRLTQVGFMVGTPRYMAPEQIEGGEVTERTDIYSLGIVLYEMLTGEAPFKAKTPAAVMMHKLQQAPPSPRALRGDIPAAVEALVLQMMEVDPARRPSDSSEVISRLRALIDAGGPLRAEPGSLHPALDATILTPASSLSRPAEPTPPADPTVAPVTPAGTSAVRAAPIEATPTRAEVPPTPVAAMPGWAEVPPAPIAAATPVGPSPLPTERQGQGRKGGDTEVGARREVDGDAGLGPSRDAPVPPLRPARARSRRLPAMAIVVVMATGLGLGAWWLVSGRAPEGVVTSSVVSAPPSPEVAPRDVTAPGAAETGLASSQKEDAAPLAGNGPVVSSSPGSPPPPAPQGPTLVEGENRPAGPEANPPRLQAPSFRATDGGKKVGKQQASRGTDRPEPVPPAAPAAPKAVTQEPSRPSPASIKAEVERRLRQADLSQLLVQVDDQRNVVLMGVTETTEDKARAISLARAVSGAADVRPRINVRVP